MPSLVSSYSVYPDRGDVESRLLLKEPIFDENDLFHFFPCCTYSTFEHDIRVIASDITENQVSLSNLLPNLLLDDPR